MQIPVLPDTALLFESDDLDAVRARLDAFNGSHWRCAHGAGPLGFRYHVLRGRSLYAAQGQANLSQTLRGGTLEPVLHFPVVAGAEYRLGRRQDLVAGPGDVIFLPPGRLMTRRMPAGRLFAIALCGQGLQRELAARSAQPSTASAVPERVLKFGGRWASSMVEAARELVSLMAASPDTGAPEGMSVAEARVVGLVADALDEGGEAAASETLPVKRLRVVEEWVDAHLREPITLGRLCEVAGVGGRSLQKSFLAHRQVTPMEFVAERRLATAHARILAEKAEYTVTRIALECGFHHIGRFGSLYRAAYGEPPSRTRMRALGLAAVAPRWHDGVLRNPGWRQHAVIRGDS